MYKQIKSDDNIDIRQTAGKKIVEIKFQEIFYKSARGQSKTKRNQISSHGADTRLLERKYFKLRLQDKSLIII